jgi:hypothetical protein
MGTIRVAGIRFFARPLDHDPPHVHAFTGSGEVIVELLGNGRVRLSDRDDAVRGATLSDVKKSLKAAAAAHSMLFDLWKKAH